MRLPAPVSTALGDAWFEPSPIDGYDRAAMIVLAADTSTSFNSVAVCDGGAVLAESCANLGRRHSERLLDTVDWVLSEAGLTLDAIELLAIAVGPGSFTGLRVGVATWKGLAAGLNVPLAGIGTLDALVRTAPFINETVCPLLDARMKEVFGAVYRFDSGQRIEMASARVASVESIIGGLKGPVTFLGDGAALYRDRILECVPGAHFMPDAFSIPRGWAVAAEALDRIAHGLEADAAHVEPFYLRKAQAMTILERRAAETVAP